MKLIKCADGARYVNPDHIISVYIADAYENGRPVDGWQVVANMTFGGGSEILFFDSFSECENYIKNM